MPRRSAGPRTPGPAVTAGHRPVRARHHRAALVAALVAGALGLGACGSTTDSSTPPATGPGSSVVAPGTAALLTRLAVEGSDAVFEQRFAGALDAGGEAGPLVFAGRAGGQAVVYACDGTEGVWFTGDVAGDGSGTLRSLDGTASVALAPADGGLQATFTGGAFDRRSTTVAALEPGEGALVRLEATAAAGGPDAAAGGIIVTPAGVRGVLTSSITDGSSNTILVGEGDPTTTTTKPGITTTTTGGIADGNSNTVIVGEGQPTTTKPGITTTTTGGITDGNSNTVIVGEGQPTTTKTPATSIVDGTSNTITVVSRTTSGLLTVRLTGHSDGTSSTATSSTTTSSTTAAPTSTATTSTTRTTTSGCAVQAATFGDLVRALSGSRGTTQSRLEALRQERLKASAAELSRLDRSIAKLERQLANVDEQLAELTRQGAICRVRAGTTR